MPDMGSPRRECAIWPRASVHYERPTPRGPGQCKEESTGTIGFGFRPGEIVGRTVFGILAVILDIVAALIWFRLIRPRASGSKDP